MHRHGYKGRKFGRKTDQRHALIAGLADALILSETIETTLPKAKEAVRYTERLITKAKRGGLHNRRQIMSKLPTPEAAHKLMDDIAPKLSSRSSGYLRIKRTTSRRGDGAQLAGISFVDDLSSSSKSTAKEPKPKANSKKKTSAKKAARPKAAKAQKEVEK